MSQSLPTHGTAGHNTAGIATGSGASIRPEASRAAFFTCGRCGAHMVCTANNADGTLAAGAVQTYCAPTAGGCKARRVLHLPPGQLGTEEEARAMRRTVVQQCKDSGRPCGWCAGHQPIVKELLGTTTDGAPRLQGAAR